MAVIAVDPNRLEKKIRKKIDEISYVLGILGFPNEIEKDEMKIEVTPNRPDAYSEEGIIRILKAFFYDEIKEYNISRNYGTIKINQVNSRPFIQVAVLENIIDNENLIESLMNLQEKIHSTSGRNRKKIAIGIHDLDKIKFPLKYEEVEEISFVPLNYNEKMSIEEILEKHEKGKEFSHLVEKGKYPIIYDSEGVISFPPIINSERTKVTEKTKNILIDVTGTSEDAVGQTINIIVCALSDRGGKICSIKTEDGRIFPNLEKRKMKYSKREIEKLLGFKIEDEIKLLRKMGVVSDKNQIEIPPYRVDFISSSDIAEDIVIAYGYDKINPEKLDYQTEGRKNYSEDIMKDIFVSMGFKEVYNFFLVSKKDIYNFNEKEDIFLVNSLTDEFNTIRPNLAIGLVKTIAENKREPLPLKFFEIGHVYNKKEYKKAGFIIADEKININVGLEIIKAIMVCNNKQFEVFEQKKEIGINGRSYDFKSTDGKIYGFVFELSPYINEKYNVDLPIIIGELTLTP